MCHHFLHGSPSRLCRKHAARMPGPRHLCHGCPLPHLPWPGQSLAGVFSPQNLGCGLSLFHYTASDKPDQPPSPRLLLAWSLHSPSTNEVPPGPRGSRQVDEAS